MPNPDAYFINHRVYYPLQSATACPNSLEDPDNRYLVARHTGQPLRLCYEQATLIRLADYFKTLDSREVRFRRRRTRARTA